MSGVSVSTSLRDLTVKFTEKYVETCFAINLLVLAPRGNEYNLFYFEDSSFCGKYKTTVMFIISTLARD